MAGSSRTINITVLNADSTPPAPPVISGSSASSSSVSLQWAASTDPAGPGEIASGVAHYRIYRGGTLVGSVAAPATSFMDTGLSAATAYEHTVSAVDAAGNESAPSSPCSTTTLGSSTEFAGYTPTRYVAPWSSVSGAANDYADLGAASYASAANASTPTTLGTALARATAGTTIGVLPGTGATAYVAQYITPHTFTPQWRATNSGDATSGPIRIVAKYPAVMHPGTPGLWSELRNSPTTVEWNGNPTFGTNGQHYIEWIGFFVDEAVSFGTGDNGPASLNGTSHSAIKYCRIRSNGNNPEGPDSLHCCLRVEGCSGANVVSHNQLFNNNPSFTTWNEAALHVSHVGDLLIEHNEIWNSSGGIMVKRNWNAPGAVTIRFNHIHDCSGGIRVDSLCPTGNLDPAYRGDVYQNLIVNCAGAALWFANSSNVSNAHVTMQNNTAVGCGQGCGTHQDPFDAGAGHKFVNNIIDTAGRAYNWDNWTAGQLAALSAGDFAADRNVFHSCATFFDGDNIAPQPLSYWQTTVGQDVNSITSDPLFVGGGSYALQAGSSARTLGRDVLNLSGSGVGAVIPAGCYLTGAEIIGTGY